MRNRKVTTSIITWVLWGLIYGLLFTAVINIAEVMRNFSLFTIIIN